MAGSLTIGNLGNLFQERIVVGVGDMAVSNKENITLSTYALGSCIGLVVFDGVHKVGGLIHIMLPESRLSPEKAISNPAMFADVGIPKFIKDLYGLGAMARNMRIFIGGGANVINQNDDLFKIGERNIAATKAMLRQHGLREHYSSIGGFSNRTIHLDMATAKLTIKRPEGTQTASLA